MMIYAAKIRKTDGALTVGGINGKLLNEAFAFADKAAFDAEQARLWEGDCFSGFNLVRLSRKQIEGYFGKSFCVANNGRIFADDYEAQRYDEMNAEYANA